MVNMNYYGKLSAIALLSCCLLILTGCPGPGDRMRLDETAQVNQKDANICLTIDDAQDYQPVDMGINLRGTPSKKKNFDFSPELMVVNGELCIPSAYYHFENGNKYIVEFILHSVRRDDEPRSFVVGVGLNNNRVYNFPLTDREITRPYGSIEVSE